MRNVLYVLLGALLITTIAKGLHEREKAIGKPAFQRTIFISPDDAKRAIFMDSVYKANGYDPRTFCTRCGETVGAEHHPHYVTAEGTYAAAVTPDEEIYWRTAKIAWTYCPACMTTAVNPR